MSKLVPINRQTAADKINRGREVSRVGDKIRGLSVGLLDIDSALYWYFENIIKPDIKEAGEQVKVPVMYANPERWFAIQRQGYIRDKKRKIICPVIVFRRTSMTKDTTIPVDKLDPTNPKLHHIFQSNYSSVNRYDKFSATRGTIPKKEMYSVAVPDYVVLSYDFTIWTNFTDQMNNIIEKINWSEGSYWGETGKFRFRATIDSFDDASEFESNRRNIKTNFSVTLNGYLLPDSYPPTADTTEQFITPTQVSWGDDADSTIIAPSTGEAGTGTTVMPGGSSGGSSGGGSGGTGTGSMETLTLQPGNNLVFENVYYDGTTPVTGTIGISDNPIFTSVSASFISASSMNVTGDLTVGGNITAQEFHTEYVTSSVIFQSGSTKFGDTSDDTHQFTGSLLLDGALTVDDEITVGQYIKHKDDSNTYLNFTNDRLRFNIGGISYIDLNDAGNAPHDVTFNDGSNNVDFIIKGDNNNPLFKTDASHNRIGTHGKGSPEVDFHIGGSELRVDGTISGSDYGGNISGSATSTGSFGYIEVAGEAVVSNVTIDGGSF
jgi:hypothetical protein